MSQPATAPLPPLVPAAVLKARVAGLTDARAEEAAAAASALVRRRCGWHIAPVLTGHRLVVDSAGGQILHLPSLKLLDVTAVTERGTAVPINGPDTDSTAGVDWSADGLLFRESGWRRGLRAVAATVDHGHDEIPDLRDLIVTLVARAVATARTAGMVREQTGPFSVEFAQPGTALADHELDVLSPFLIAE